MWWDPAAFSPLNWTDGDGGSEENKTIYLEESSEEYKKQVKQKSINQWLTVWSSMVVQSQCELNEL